MSKNAVLEYHQKRRLAMPTFSTDRVGGSDDCPLWQSTVQLGWNNESFTGFERNTKKEAEQSAATECLKYLKGKHLSDDSGKGLIMDTTDDNIVSV